MQQPQVGVVHAAGGVDNHHGWASRIQAEGLSLEVMLEAGSTRLAAHLA